MGVRIAYDPVDDIATIYDSVTGAAFGPIFDGDGGTERCEAFLASLEHDARGYSENELRKLAREWREANPREEDEDEYDDRARIERTFAP